MNVYMRCLKFSENPESQVCLSAESSELPAGAWPGRPSEGRLRALLPVSPASSRVLLWAAPRGNALLDFRIAIKVDLHQEEPLSPPPSFRTRISSSWSKSSPSWLQNACIFSRHGFFPPVLFLWTSFLISHQTSGWDWQVAHWTCFLFCKHCFHSISLCPCTVSSILHQLCDTEGLRLTSVGGVAWCPLLVPWEVSVTSAS